MSRVPGPDLLPVDVEDEATEAAEGEPGAPGLAGGPAPSVMGEGEFADAAPTGCTKGTGNPGGGGA